MPLLRSEDFEGRHYSEIAKLNCKKDEAELETGYIDISFAGGND